MVTSDIIECVLLGEGPLWGTKRNRYYDTCLREPFVVIYKKLIEVQRFICDYEHRPSIYFRTFCRAVRLEILNPFEDVLSQYAAQSLDQESQIVAFPISRLHVLLHNHHSIINATFDAFSSISSQPGIIRGIRVIDVVLDFCHSGIPHVGHVFTKILHRYLNQVIINQVISWIVYGKLSDPYQEFWIVHNHSIIDSWDFSYQIDISMVPETYLSFEICRSILFIGKALHISRFHPTSTARGHHQKYLDQLLPFVHKQIALKEEFGCTIREIHQQAAESLWCYVVEEQNLLVHLSYLKSFFFLANGAFYEEFIAQCGDQILSRFNRSSSTHLAQNAFQFAARMFHLDDSDIFERFQLYTRCKHFTVDFKHDATAFSLLGCSRHSDGNGIILTSPKLKDQIIKETYSLIWSTTQCYINNGFHIAFAVQMSGSGIFSFVLQNNSPYALLSDLACSLWVEFARRKDKGFTVSVRYNSTVLKSWDEIRSNIFDGQQYHISIKWAPYDLQNEKASLQIHVDDACQFAVAADRINRKVNLLGQQCFIGFYGLPYRPNDLEEVSRFGDHEGDFLVQAVSWRELHEPNSISQIDLSLDFQVPKGIDLLLGRPDIDRYSEIFNFLLRIKFVHWYLRRAWRSTDRKFSSYETCLLRSRMQFLVDNLQIYLQVDVIETQYASMVSSIQSTRDFDAARLAHDRYLVILAQHFFLRSQVIMKALTHVLDICLQFCKALEDHQEHIEAQIHTFSELFHRESCFLFSVLSNKARQQSSPHLEQLILRIDFNGFLSSTLTEAGLK